MTTNEELSKVQAATAESLQSITSISLLDGALIKDIDLITSKDNAIEHKLGRRINGAILLLPSSQATVWADQTNNSAPSKVILIQTSANTTVSLWVF